VAGVKGRSGPPGNMNNFKHGLVGIQRRREKGVTTEREESIKAEILNGLVDDKGGDGQISAGNEGQAESGLQSVPGSNIESPSD